MSDINDLLDNSSPSQNPDPLSISKLANRFKSLVLVLYVISVVLISLVILTGFILSSINNAGAVIFFVILGGVIALIINEITFGLIATIIDIRDNVRNIKN